MLSQNSSKLGNRQSHHSCSRIRNWSYFAIMKVKLCVFSVTSIPQTHVFFLWQVDQIDYTFWPGSLYFLDREHTVSMFSFLCPGLFDLPIFFVKTTVVCWSLLRCYPSQKGGGCHHVLLALKCLNDTCKKKMLFHASLQMVGACVSSHVLRVTTPSKTWSLSKMCLLHVKVVKSNTQWMEVKARKCWLDENETKLEVWGRYSRYASYFKSFQLCSKGTSFLASADCS